MKRPPTPANLRFCQYCKDVVEDEVHFVSECQLYDEFRDELLSKCYQLERNVSHISTTEDLFAYLFTSRNPAISLYVGQFLIKCAKKRKEVLY